MEPKLQRQVQRYGWDRAAQFYERYWRAQLRPATELLLARARLQPGERVLDVACGTGAVTFAAARAVGSDGHVLGTDISAKMIATAEAKPTPCGPRPGDPCGRRCGEFEHGQRRVRRRTLRVGADVRPVNHRRASRNAPEPANIRSRRGVSVGRAPQMRMGGTLPESSIPASHRTCALCSSPSEPTERSSRHFERPASQRPTPPESMSPSSTPAMSKSSAQRSSVVRSYWRTRDSAKQTGVQLNASTSNLCRHTERRAATASGRVRSHQRKGLNERVPARA